MVNATGTRSDAGGSPRRIFIRALQKAEDYTGGARGDLREPVDFPNESGGLATIAVHRPRRIQRMRNIVCLISGRGSNLAALLDAAREDRWESTLDARIAAVISNRADSAGLARAHDAGLPALVIAHTAFPTRDAFDTALMEAIDAYSPALVVLAGFMRVLTGRFVGHYEGRLLNIHPSLLPAFPGLATHRQALAAGVRAHGATVHFVSHEVDCGAIVAQAVVPVRTGDTEETLAARVLEQEHRLLPACVRLVLEGSVRFEAGCVKTRAGCDERLLLLAA